MLPLGTTRMNYECLGLMTAELGVYIPNNSIPIDMTSLAEVCSCLVLYL